MSRYVLENLDTGQFYSQKRGEGWRYRAYGWDHPKRWTSNLDKARIYSRAGDVVQTIRKQNFPRDHLLIREVEFRLVSVETDEYLTALREGGRAVIDLNQEAWQSLIEAVSKSKWIPPEYFQNDWVTDCCEFLINGYPDLTPIPTPIGNVPTSTKEIIREAVAGTTLGSGSTVATHTYHYEQEWIAEAVFSALYERGLLATPKSVGSGSIDP